MESVFCQLLGWTESETVRFAQPESVHYQKRNPVDSNTHTSGFSGGSPASYCFPLTVSSSTGPVRSSAPTEICPSSQSACGHPATLTRDQGQATLAMTQPPGGQTLAWKKARRRDYPILGRSDGGYGGIDQEGPPMEHPLSHEMVWYTCLLSMADSLTLNGINPQWTSLFRRD